MIFPIGRKACKFKIRAAVLELVLHAYYSKPIRLRKKRVNLNIAHNRAVLVLVQFYEPIILRKKRVNLNFARNCAVLVLVQFCEPIRLRKKRVNLKFAPNSYW